MAILEALACSLPCLITTACHFPELADAQGAVVVNPEAGEVAQGLRGLLERTDHERRRLGQNGRRLVENQYTWDQQAHRLASVYKWLAGGGARPECVIP
jgi:glycosyltransferase involved in cell wall biosynthesis